jgi:hypothetical protein
MKSEFLTDEDRKVLDQLDQAQRELEVIEQVAVDPEDTEVSEDLYGNFDWTRPLELVLYSSDNAGA